MNKQAGTKGLRSEHIIPIQINITVISPFLLFTILCYHSFLFVDYITICKVDLYHLQNDQPKW